MPVKYPSHQHPAAFSNRTEDDWWLKSFGWCMRLTLRAFVVIVVLCVMIDFGFTYFDAYHAENMAKAHAKYAFDTHCNPSARAQGISAQILQDCSRQKAVMERNAWSHAYHVSAEHIADHIPGVRYCRSHPDMCALATLKFLDVMVVLFYWCPLIFGTGLLWYLWPVLASMCLKRATQNLEVFRESRQQENSSSSSKPEPPMPYPYPPHRLMVNNNSNDDKIE